jgi:hypothetical protein
MYKWFSKHLNWTIIVFTICANILSFYLVKLLLFITNISYWGPLFDNNTLGVISPPLTSFGLDAVLILADILLIIGFYWILSKKNRSWIYLLFFITFLATDIPTFLSYIVEVDLPYILYYVRLLSILLWMVGWVILLLLKNIPINIPEGNKIQSQANDKLELNSFHYNKKH